MEFTPYKPAMWGFPLLAILFGVGFEATLVQQQWGYMALFAVFVILFVLVTPLAFQKFIFKEDCLILKVPYKKLANDRTVLYQNVSCVYVATMKKGRRTIGKYIVLCEKGKEHLRMYANPFRFNVVTPRYLIHFKYTLEREAFIKQHFADRLRYATVDAKTGEKTEEQAP